MAFDLVTRILERDPTIWTKNNTAKNQLDWVDHIHRTIEYLDDLTRWAESVDQSKILVIGMGQSGIIARVYADFNKHTQKHRTREITVIDTIDPRSFADLDLTDTAVVVSQGGGPSQETEALFKFFYGRMSRRERFYAICDINSKLEAFATELNFRRVFSVPQCVNNAYCAFSEFGLVPAILGGTDIHSLLLAAQNADLNSWAELGESIGDPANNQRGVVSIAYSEPHQRSLAMWAEQLLAKSTGANDKGIIPIVSSTPSQNVADPAVPLKVSNIVDLGRSLYGLQFLAAAAAYSIGVDPYCDNDIEIDGVPMIETDEHSAQSVDSLHGLDLQEYLQNTVTENEHVTISAYQPLEHENALYHQRDLLSQKFPDNPITTGLAPRNRYLTGQLHAFGPKPLLLVQLVSKDYGPSVSIPEMDMSFQSLIKTKVNNEAHLLVELGQRVARETV